MKIGIFGSGSVGVAMAYYMSQAYKDDIYLLSNDKYYDRLNSGFIVNGNSVSFNVIKEGYMDYLFVCVKNYDLEASLSDISKFVGRSTIIIPLCNGILAHDILQNYFKNNIVYYAMIRIEANRDYNTINCSPVTEIAFGKEWNNVIENDVKALKDIMDNSNIICNVYPDMKWAVWRKFMLNVGINQISALTNSTYNDMRNPHIRELLYGLMNEVVELAKYENVNLTIKDLDFMMSDLNIRTSNRVTSLTEDVINKRKCEIDYFGKVVIDLSNKHNLKCPYNEIIYKALRGIVDNYTK